MRYKKTILMMFASILLASIPLLSQRIVTRRRRKPVILITKPGSTKKEPIKLHDLKIKINVTGNLATTTMEMTYYNPHNRVLEGQFYFPLGEGQTVSRFALEVNGRMREGVVVEKTKGRKVFESVVRSMIDPGLLEWTKGNNFKARIYPIPARGYKRLLIAYEEDLSYKQSGFLYRLPLAFQQKIKNFKLTAKVFKQQYNPKVNISENQLVNFRFGKWGTYHIAKFNRSNYRPNKQLAFFLPRTKAYRTKAVYYDRIRRSGFFYLHINPKQISSKKIFPKRVCLLWDASASMEKREKVKELKLLARYFKLIKNTKVELVIFRNKIDTRETFRIYDGKWTKLKHRLQKIVYDGGTSLGELDLTKYRCDEFILVSDAISNFGKDEIKLNRTPVITISSSLTAQHSYLRYVAQKSGGVQINLAQTTVADALRAMSTQPFSFIKASYNKKTISEVYPSLPTVVHNDFSITGKLHTKSSSITLHFGYAGKTIYTKKNMDQPDKRRCFR